MQVSKSKNVLGLLAVILVSLEVTDAFFRNKFNVDREFFEQNEDRIFADCYVTIKNGTLRGRTSTARHGKVIYTYKGIPFAAPPTGDLRFKAPQPAIGWGEEERPAVLSPPSCPQFEPALMPSNEDCLFLNVYTTQPDNQTANPLLPVMIFFHGGGFTTGETTLYNAPRILGAADVILVIAQYRLGPLGFFSTGDEAAPGNWGLKDQVKALEWIQENIEPFGGDPNKVTIFGESAGGASVIFLLMSPLARGLFSGVISQSGSALSEWALDRKPFESAQYMAGRLGCPNATSTEIVNCMKELPWERIVEEQQISQDEAYYNLDFGLQTVTPVIEPDLPGALIAEEPLTILQKNELPDVPVIIGATMHEGSYVLGELFLARLGPDNLTSDEYWLREQLIPNLLLTFGIDEGMGSASTSKSIALAFLEDSLRVDWDDMMPGLVDLMSVFFMKAPALRTAEILSNRLSNVYLYSFEHHSNNSLWWIFFLGESIPIEHGITHADDLLYLFALPGFQNEADFQFSDLICHLWTNFAAYGNPTPIATEEYPVWPTFKIDNPQYMKLNLTPTVQYDVTKSWRPRGFEPK